MNIYRQEYYFLFHDFISPARICMQCWSCRDQRMKVTDDGKITQFFQNKRNRNSIMNGKRIISSMLICELHKGVTITINIICMNIVHIDLYVEIKQL